MMFFDTKSINPSYSRTDKYNNPISHKRTKESLVMSQSQSPERLVLPALNQARIIDQQSYPGARQSSIQPKRFFDQPNKYMCGNDMKLLMNQKIEFNKNVNSYISQNLVSRKKRLNREFSNNSGGGGGTSPADFKDSKAKQKMLHDFKKEIFNREKDDHVKMRENIRKDNSLAQLEKKLKKEVYKNILDKQNKKKVFNLSRPYQSYTDSKSYIDLEKEEDKILSHLSKKKYSKRNYDPVCESPSEFFTSPLPQSVAKKSPNYNRFNQPKWYEQYKEKAQKIRKEKLAKSKQNSDIFDLAAIINKQKKNRDSPFRVNRSIQQKKSPKRSQKEAKPPLPKEYLTGTLMRNSTLNFMRK
ncbi:unnamed protein product [Moneuplotes crassus]|uniref:Uncharacterized protein n=1 Tax=Euplotes crassus TaxID=5936 RepID=A0AAD1ULZ5_EUPCR|nr:unnamed protein product [Moneuplotes crassus]